ncbi:hypothetical protein AVEN_274712-1 [Araneus ventricosus]|uniref:Uncharacterized protein n=1 Tax=Araneus ventricosus TaxID=182803 RepID=A0A4Y2N7S5_ARAVE|nr:hypothetical protein AVEN_274712-1 [Araneus ventricosus]
MGGRPASIPEDVRYDFGREQKHFFLFPEMGISSFAYREFNSNFTCGDPTILPYELIHSRNRGTVDHNVHLPRAWKVLDVYASRLIMPPDRPTTGIWCTVLNTALRTFHSSCDKFGKPASLFREEIG